MHQNIIALTEALTQLHLPFGGIEGFRDAVFTRGVVFIRSVTPFNTESVSTLCRDKSAVYTALRGSVPMPKTLSFLDPHSKYPELVIAKDFDEIFKKSSALLYPWIVKMNSGERGIHVYHASNETEARSAYKIIFDKDSKYYDYIALVQEYIEPKHEIRVVISGSVVSFAYIRETADSISGDTLEKVTRLSKSILEIITLSWGAFDFIESKSGELFFLEANTHPNFDTLISKQGNSLLVNAYKQALTKYFGL